MKHFNAGFVWGRVAKAKKEFSHSGTPYLTIEAECPNEIFGNIRTYGRLWGEDKIDAFLDYHKKHPGAAYKFQGFFSQYDKDEGTRYSNYTFFAWQPVEGKEFRATFVLTGAVTGAEKTPDNDGKLYLSLTREGSGDYKDINEDFEVYTFEPQKIDGLNEGDLVQIKGVLRYKEAEDYFGASSSGSVRPYVMEMKVFAPETSQEVF